MWRQMHWESSSSRQELISLYRCLDCAKMCPFKWRQARRNAYFLWSCWTIPVFPNIQKALNTSISHFPPLQQIRCTYRVYANTLYNGEYIARRDMCCRECTRCTGVEVLCKYFACTLEPSMPWSRQTIPQPLEPNHLWFAACITTPTG